MAGRGGKDAAIFAIVVGESSEGVDALVEEDVDTDVEDSFPPSSSAADVVDVVAAPPSAATAAEASEEVVEMVAEAEDDDEVDVDEDEDDDDDSDDDDDDDTDEAVAGVMPAAAYNG